MNVDLFLVTGGCALAVLVVGWLVVSFSRPGPKRTVVEWLSAAAMYSLLFLFFFNLVLDAIEEDSTVALVAFGFLCALFGGGLLIALYQLFTVSKRDGDSGTGATN